MEPKTAPRGGFAVGHDGSIVPAGPAPDEVVSLTIGERAEQFANLAYQLSPGYGVQSYPVLPWASQTDQYRRWLIAIFSQLG